MKYRPFLLTKQGERQALEALETYYHDQIIPIFVVSPRVWDYNEDRYSKSTEDHLVKLPNDLFTARGERIAYIDTRHLDEPDSNVNGHHLLLWLIDEAYKLGLSLIPILDPQSTMHTISAAVEVAKKCGCGLSIRIPAGRQSFTSAEVSTLLSRVNLPTSDVDLIFDLETDVNSGRAARVLVTEVLQASQIGQWRSITLGGAGYPDDNPVGRGLHEIPREDWAAYLAVWEQLREHNLEPLDFSDYAISGLAPAPDVDPKLLTISSTFRYTMKNKWLFSRGELYKARGGRGLGGEAVPSTVKQLLEYPSYNGSPVSQVHQWFDEVLVNGKGGNPTTWRKWSTYHHLRVAADQVANLHELSSTL